MEIQGYQKRNCRILFAEGNDIRMIQAAIRLREEEEIVPVLYGKKEEIQSIAVKHHWKIDRVEILDPEDVDEKVIDHMIDEMVNIRRGRWDKETCREKLKQGNYFTTMCVQIGLVDGLLGGSSTSTADTLRPALQLVKTKPGSSIVSSCFLMRKDKKSYIFSDCSLNINPSADELVEITLQTAKTAKNFSIDPHVGILSYSTFGSGSGESVDKMHEVAQRLKRMSLDFKVDGEMQVDAALSMEVAKLKAPESEVAGHVNVLIFPTLDAGNIGYKLVARLGGFEAIGPILQGLNKPINDLSRGCNVEEVYKMALITAAQTADTKETVSAA